MIKERKPRLLLLQLDKGYQDLYRIEQNCGGKEKTTNDLLWVIKCSILLCDEAVEIVPAFIHESEISYNLFSSNPTILDSQYVILKIRENDKLEYFENKLHYYRRSKGYESYKDSNFKKLLLESRAKIEQKDSSRKFIELQFTLHLNNTELGENEVLAISQGLENIKEQPLTWEIFRDKVIKKNKFLFSQSSFYRYFIFSAYQNANINPNTTATITYQNYSLGFSEPKNLLYDLGLFESALRMAEVYIKLNNLQISHIDQFKDSIAFTKFKDEYFDIILSSNTTNETRSKLAQLAEKFKHDLNEQISKILNPYNNIRTMSSPKINDRTVIVITVNRHETAAIYSTFLPQDAIPETKTINGLTYVKLGLCGDINLIHIECEMGSGGIGASQQRINDAILHWQPKAVIAIGIAFGMNEENQKIGDVLVSSQIQDYELSRVNSDGNINPRSDRAHASDILINRLRQTDAIKQHINYPNWPRIHIGLMITGQKLLDNREFKDDLVSQFPDSIGGEMEGLGLYISASTKKVDWIIIKSICDWGHNKNNKSKEELQKIAANNSALVAREALSLNNELYL